MNSVLLLSKTSLSCFSPKHHCLASFQNITVLLLSKTSLSCFSPKHHCLASLQNITTELESLRVENFDLRKDNLKFLKHLKSEIDPSRIERRCTERAPLMPKNSLKRGEASFLTHDPTWQLVANNETRPVQQKERRTEKRINLGSPQGLPNWAWQMHGQVSGTQMPLLSAAASSGFSFSTPNPSSIVFPPKPYNQTLRNMHSTSSDVIATNNSQYYYQMKPSPAQSSTISYLTPRNEDE